MANRSRRTFLAATAALPLLVRMRPANAVPTIEVLQPLVQKVKRKRRGLASLYRKEKPIVTR